MTSDRLSVRYAASGLIEVLAPGEVERRIRDGRIGPTDRVARADGVYVRWTADARFSGLAMELGLASGASPAATAPHSMPARAAATPGPSPAVDPARREPAQTPPPISTTVRRVDTGSHARASDPEAALRAARDRMGQSRAVGQAMDRLRAVQQTSGSLPAVGTVRSGQHAAIVRPVLDANLLAQGPEAVRSALLSATPEEILGVEATASARRLDAAKAQQCEAIENAWPQGDYRVRESDSRAARVDAIRIVAAAHRVFTTPSERAKYDRLRDRLKRAPLFTEVVEFVPTAPTVDVEAPGKLSDEDAAVLRYVGFDPQKLKDEKQAAQRASTRNSAPVKATAPAPQKKTQQQALLLALLLAGGAALVLGPCSPEEESTEGFRQLDE